MDTPKISVVVASDFAREDELRRCVARLTLLDYPDFEVIVVDNRSGNIVSPVDIPGARVVREPYPGASAARNRGAAVATSEIIAFTDDDVVVDIGWLKALAGRFAREPDVAAVTGAVIPLELNTPAQIMFEKSDSAFPQGLEPLTFERAGRFEVVRRAADGTERVGSLYATGEYGSHMAFRAAALRSVGGYDVRLGPGTPTRSGEDLGVLIALLWAGYKIAYEPTAIICHSHRATLQELESQVHGYGIGFTAMLTAAAVRDPRHLMGLAAVVPAWLRSLARKQASQPAPPRSFASAELRVLAGIELRGKIVGPPAYLHSQARGIVQAWRRVWAGPRWRSGYSDAELAVFAELAESQSRARRAQAAAAKSSA
jgi:GT2 family glycosyltransferase